MKKYTVPAALLLTAVLAAGCGQAAAPEAVETAATESAETVQETTDGEKAAESVESVPAVIDNPCLRAANEYFTEWAGENIQAAEGLTVKDSCIIALKLCSNFVISAVNRNLSLISLFPFRIFRTHSYIIKRILHFSPHLAFSA